MTDVLFLVLYFRCRWHLVKAGGLVTTATRGQFLAQVHREFIDPSLLSPRLRQDMAELDHVGASEVVQVHPHHRFGNAQQSREKISNSHQDVVLGGARPFGANVAVDEHAVVGCGLQPYEMVVGLEVTKNTLAERNRSISEPAVEESKSGLPMFGDAFPTPGRP